MTALQGLRDQGRVRAGQSVMVIGASGGVGTFAVQIAKAFGAEVTGVCGPSNLELVRSIGADHVVDYTQTDVTAAGIRYDVIFQAAGTASAAPASAHPHARRHARAEQRPGPGLRHRPRHQGRPALPFVKERLAVFVTKENGVDLGTLADMVAAGQVLPVIDRTYPLAEAAKALGYLEAGHARGKVVITV